MLLLLMLLLLQLLLLLDGECCAILGKGIGGREVVVITSVVEEVDHDGKSFCKLKA